MISKYIYKHCYIPTEKHDRELYKKSLSFRHCIPFISDKMWTHITSNITESELLSFIQETNNDYDSQLPKCKFGSFLYKTCFQHCINLLTTQISQHMYILNGQSELDILHKINMNTVPLKMFICFVYDTHHRWNLSLIHERVPITILPEYSIGLTDCCPTFEISLFKEHTDCMKTYALRGLVFNTEINHRIISMNNPECLHTLKEYGFSMDKELLLWAFVNKKWNIVNYGMKTINIPVIECLPYCKTIVQFLDAIEEYLSINKTFITRDIKHILDYYWVYISEHKYPNIISFILDKDMHTMRWNKLYDIENHIRILFHA